MTRSNNDTASARESAAVGRNCPKPFPVIILADNAAPMEPFAQFAICAASV